MSTPDDPQPARDDDDAPEYPPPTDESRLPRSFAPLKSTYKSKEIAFDLDSDDVGSEDGVPHDLVELPQEDLPKASAERNASDSTDLEDGPLLEGLVAESKRRGSIDVGLTRPERPWDPIEDVNWREKGGGLLAGIANMSNS